MKHLKKIFESRFASIFCFLFAIVNRIIFTSLYSLVGVDTKTQIVYAENLLAGKGMGMTKYFTADLNTPVFDTQQVFPPGFSFAIIPFLKLFSGDQYMAVLAFDILVAILFVIAIRILGRKVGLSPLLNNIVTLIAGCSQYFFFMSWSSTDAISVCLLLFSIIATIDIIHKKEQLSWLKATGIGFLFFSSFFFRFMYLPVTILIPVFILVSGFLLKNRNLKTSGSKILLTCVLFLTSYFVFSSITSGNALYVTNVGRGIFPDQLAECYPFFPASFINIDFGAQLIQTFTGLEYSQTMFFLKLINAIFFVLSIFLLCRYLYKQKRSLRFSDHFTFIILGSLIALLILLLLAWLTLTYKELIWGYHRWTHVQDPRYFAFIYVFVPLALLVCLQHYSDFFKKNMIRFFLFLAYSCFLIEILHGIYYNGKILVSHKDLNYIRLADQGFKKFPALIEEIKKKNPGKELVVSSPDKFYLLTASQMGYKAIFDYSEFLKSDIKPSAKTILIMPIQTRDVIIIEEYLARKKPVLYASIAGTSFYIEEINP